MNQPFKRYRSPTPITGLVLLFLLALMSMPVSADVTNPSRRTPQRTFLPQISSNTRSLLGPGWANAPEAPLPYLLQAEDDLADLAIDLGRDVALMACVTPSGTYPLSELRPGQLIAIPPAHAICHTVQPGETLETIAASYQVSTTQLLDFAWNGLLTEDDLLEAGRRLLILEGSQPLQTEQHVIPQAIAPVDVDEPTPVPPAPADDDDSIWPYGDGEFIWPVRGQISQGHTGRHKAIDIAANFGLPVVASDNGVVQKAGWSTTGYGLRVVIDHQIDYLTLYAHLSEIYVEEGQTVEKGQVIGAIGSTGNSTGAHLHFEIRDFGYLIDPLSLLQD